MEMTDLQVIFLGTEGRAPESMGVLVNESIMLEAPPTATSRSSPAPP